MKTTPRMAALTVILLACVSHSAGFSLVCTNLLGGLQQGNVATSDVGAGSLLLRGRFQGVGAGSILLRRTPVVPARKCTARPTMELQATAGEEKILEVLKQSVTVTATREECFKVASDLDSYTEWCRKGGMKKVMVIERDEQNRASKVQVCMLSRNNRKMSKCRILHAFLKLVFDRMCAVLFPLSHPPTCSPLLPNRLRIRII